MGPAKYFLEHRKEKHKSNKHHCKDAALQSYMVKGRRWENLDDEMVAKTGYGSFNCVFSATKYLGKS